GRRFRTPPSASGNAGRRRPACRGRCRAARSPPPRPAGPGAATARRYARSGARRASSVLGAVRWKSAPGRSWLGLRVVDIGLLGVAQARAQLLAEGVERTEV